MMYSIWTSGIRNGTRWGTRVPCIPKRVTAAMHQEGRTRLRGSEMTGARERMYDSGSQCFVTKTSSG